MGDMLFVAVIRRWLDLQRGAPQGEAAGKP